MTKQELKPLIGQFGTICAGEKGYTKTVSGTIKDMDIMGSIWFVDNEGYGYFFKCNAITSFEQKEFQPLPEKYAGKEIESDDGTVHYKYTTKEVDLKK